MNILETRKIGALLGLRFNVPSYQRGYRWNTKDAQVENLLNDLWAFNTACDAGGDGYCLQPVVVKKALDDSFELIDGQQRLTTILLILHYLNEHEFRQPKKLFDLKFVTRIAQRDFLSHIDDAVRVAENIDMHHLHQAYHFIGQWFKERLEEHPSIQGDFYSKLVSHTWVIWYEVADEGNELINIFTRLNVGKIPLTNAELIKALFLSRQPGAGDHQQLARQILAGEWDAMERALQDQQFWYFVCKDPDAYDTRMDFIFDNLYTKPTDAEAYYTFCRFSAALKRADDEGDNTAAARLWLDVKQYFLTLQDWYEDHELFHLVGYLVSVGAPIADLVAEAKGKTKSAFKQHLLSKVPATVPKRPEDLSYDEGRDREDIRKTLLLFNILSTIRGDAQSTRFPFHRYKTEAWDIEHIRSATAKEPDNKDRLEWARTMFHYFAGIPYDAADPEPARSRVAALEEQFQGWCHSLIAVMANPADQAAFNAVYAGLRDHFKEGNNLEDVDAISNLTLLDSATNRGYKNAFFPVKRRWIIEREGEGAFVPRCTKNVFMKAYSTSLANLTSWDKTDAADYLTQIQTTLTA